MGSKKRSKKKVAAKAPVKKPKRPKAQKKASKKLPLVNFKCASKDQRVLRANAKKYAGGNFSAWLRHAAIHYRPKKGEVIR